MDSLNTNSFFLIPFFLRDVVNIPEVRPGSMVSSHQRRRLSPELWPCFDRKVAMRGKLGVEVPSVSDIVICRECIFDRLTLFFLFFFCADKRSSKLPGNFVCT